MFKFFTFRLLAAFIVSIFLIGCESTSVGAVSINGAPSKIEIKENSPDGMFVKGMDISINSEFVGMAKRIGLSSRSGLDSKIAFEPVQSKYGEIRIVQNVSSSLAGTIINFDVYVAGSYAGNVQMARAI